MPTFVLERVTPSAFEPDNAEMVALHSRWATDAYHVGHRDRDDRY